MAPARIIREAMVHTVLLTPVQSNLFNCIASVPRKFDALIQLCSYRICYELSHVVTSLGA
jgi:hypothetical protein